MAHRGRHLFHATQRSSSSRIVSRRFLLLTWSLLLLLLLLLPNFAVADGIGPNNIFSNHHQHHPNEKRPRIVGGRPVPRGEYPYLVDLENAQGEHKCMGALLAPDLVLTAAHCRGSFSSARVGRSDKRDPSDAYDDLAIGSIILHPLFIEKDFIYDVMVVRVRGRPSDQPVLKLNSNPNLPIAGQVMHIAGFGNTETDGEFFPNRLLDTTVTVMTNEECELSEGPLFSYLGEISDDMLCAQELGQDSCQGDSGGPLILKGDTPEEDIQIGIVSWGRDCADPDFPGVYSRISKSFHWLRRLVCQESVAPPEYLECGRIISAPTPPSPTPVFPPKKEPPGDDTKDDSSKVYGDADRGNLNRRTRQRRRGRILKGTL